MNFKLKTLVAAVALAAIAGQASATNIGNDVTAAGGSDLFFFATNSDGASFIQDLGLQSLDASSFNKAVGSAYSSFVSGSSDASSIAWGVAAATFSGTVGQKYVDFTVSAGADTSALANGNIGSVASGTSGTLHNIIAAGTSAQAAVSSTTGIYSTAAGANWAVYANGPGSDFLGNFPFTIDNSVGTTGVLFEKAATAGTGAASVLASQTTLGQFGFNGTTLTYTVAAVPEPETYGMLAAGLLMLGAVARRRKV